MRRMVCSASVLCVAMLGAVGCDDDTGSTGQTDTGATDVTLDAPDDGARDTRTPGDAARDTPPDTRLDTATGSDSSEDTGFQDTGRASLCDRVSLGPNADLGGEPLFPQDSYWNQPIDDAPVDPNSDAIIASMGADTGLHTDFGCCWGGPFGIPYVVVDETTPEVPVSFQYADESDPGPYPVPPNAPIEGGEDATGDRHVLVVDCAEEKLYELFAAEPQSDGSWQAGSGAVWDLGKNPVRSIYCTSADAAGLPVLPGLVRYDEVEAGTINHALRFTVSQTRKAFVRPPASHWASGDTSEDLPPMGMRVRLKTDAELASAGIDVSSFSEQSRVIVRTMQTYGMILADNGSDWYVSGMPHQQWSDSDLVAELGQIEGRHFEVIEMENVVVDYSVGPGQCDLP